MPSWQHLICLENKAQTFLYLYLVQVRVSVYLSLYLYVYLYPYLNLNLCMVVACWLWHLFCVYGANLASFVGRDFCLISTQ